MEGVKSHQVSVCILLEFYAQHGTFAAASAEPLDPIVHGQLAVFLLEDVKVSTCGPLAVYVFLRFGRL
jgi:hypothetical protein